MRGRKRFKKIRVPPFLEDLKKEILKRAAGITVIFLFIIISFLLAKAFLYRSDYFKLKTVEIKDISTGQIFGSFTSGELLRTYKDKNIFEIDIKGIAKYLHTSYPDAKDIITRRVMPDKLVVDLNFRKPVALISNGKYYAIDENCFLLSNPDADVLKGLVVITGINIRSEERRGKAVDSKNLRHALELLKEMRRLKFSVESNVQKIEAGDINNLLFYLKNGIEIRIGSEDFRVRLIALKKIMKDPRLVADKIKYIDLRFEDVVIGPK